MELAVGDLLKRAAQRTEAFVKGMLFDCRQCGQCVLSQTGLICPMSCPKGLRNGPCGGTLHGECEVDPRRRCVHVQIHQRTAGDRVELLPLRPSPDAALAYTSSYANYLTGRDREARTPLEYLDLGSQRTSGPCRTASGFEAALRTGGWVMTTEIRSPRSASWSHLESEASLLRGQFDAVNATAYLNGRPSVSSPIAASRLVELGLEPIAQATARDHTKTSFISELLQSQLTGVHNTLCLTGDSFVGTPRIRQVYDMDSALMLYEARHLRETGTIHFTGQAVKEPPRPFLGAAINPYTEPIEVPLRRLKQKAAAGADFIQSQLVFDVDGFAAFMGRAADEGLPEELFILAGVPVVISPKALAMVPTIPGVHCPEAVRQRLEQATDLRREGVAMAIETVQALRRMPGVAGAHLMLFGADSSALLEVAQATHGGHDERKARLA